MKCDYCSGEDHLITACPKKSGDRRFELGLGCLFTLLLGPFFVVGIICGAIWSAFSCGTKVADNTWPEAWRSIRNKKDEDSGNGAV